MGTWKSADIEDKEPKNFNKKIVSLHLPSLSLPPVPSLSYPLSPLPSVTKQLGSQDLGEAMCKYWSQLFR